MLRLIMLAFAATLLMGASGVAKAREVLRMQLEVWAERCNNLEEAQDRRAAISACTSIIRSDSASSPARAFAYWQRGNFKLEADDRPGALADFSNAVRHNPHFAAAYISRAALYEEQRDFQRAVADYGEVIRLMPDQAGPHNARCWLRALWGSELQGARADCEAALLLAPDSPNVLDSRGMLGLREGRYDLAHADYSAAIAIGGADPHALYGRGFALLRLGRLDEANADFAAALELDPLIGQTYAGYGITP